MHQGYQGCDCNCNRVHSFFIANHSFDDSYVGKQGEFGGIAPLEDKMCHLKVSLG